MADLIEAVAGEAPLLLTIDNADCADALSIQALGDFVAGRRPRELMVTMTSRTKLHDPLQAHQRMEGIDWLRLKPLTDDAARALAAEIMERAGITPTAQAVTSCLDHAAGNPLYIQAAASEAFPPNASSTPRSLSQLLQQRIDQLGTNALHLLVACVVLGRRATVTACGIGA